MRTVAFIALPTLALVLISCASSPASESPYNRGVDAYRAKDYKEAVAQWSSAAKAGDAAAENNLGYLLFYGLGTKANTQRAIELWRAAAVQGQSESQWHLGNAYAKGEGVETNLIIAYAWYRTSVASADEHVLETNDPTERAIGEDSRKSLVELIDRMTTEQIEQSKTLANEYIGKYTSSPR